MKVGNNSVRWWSVLCALMHTHGQEEAHEALQSAAKSTAGAVWSSLELAGSCLQTDLFILSIIIIVESL